MRTDTRMSLTPCFPFDYTDASEYTDCLTPCFPLSNMPKRWHIGEGDGSGYTLDMTENAKLLPIVEETIKQYGIASKVLECKPEFADTAAFCEYYQIPLEQTANTILVYSHKVEPVRYAVCVVLGATRLDVNKKVCELLEVRRASFADAETTVRITGMEIGGVVAIGISDLPIYVDRAVMQRKEVILGGGNRSSKLLLDPQELLKLPNVQVIDDLARPKELL